MRLQDDEMLSDKFVGVSISQDEIVWNNMMEGRVARSCRDIQEQNISSK